MPASRLLEPAPARPLPHPRERTAGICGFGRALPSTVVGNVPIAARIGVEPGWITKRTGISERRRSAEALRASEARFHNLADHAPVMMWLTDASGRCTYLNRRWHEFTGQAEEDALGL
ncbi:MAG: PAS domain S-box protein, partial [Proteobacteria bacterium]|nr:PAS domain S-box protein [Pseudomonadota bacterium]